ncbi:hypothetical protein JB92DRAFT_523050 [Gautieria morchelliformis]|nr:hypothetical protein JB92DRAFT_523050 [Gautieria morchelliformis]
MFTKTSIKGFSLSTAGLIALADLSTIAHRTALKGSASFLDVLFLAAGIHRQNTASNVHGGELPAAGAMTTGYAFRIENQATVSYLQKVGKSSCLVNVQVTQCDTKSPVVGWLRDLLLTEDIAASLLYLLGVALTIVVVALLGAIRDFWAIGVLLLLMLARLLNVVVIKRRSMPGWKGAEEKGGRGDLLVTLSQDRWVRMQGLVDDLNAVTAGQWLRDETTVEGFATSFATLLVYVAAAVAINSSTVGNLLIGCLLLISGALWGDEIHTATGNGGGDDKGIWTRGLGHCHGAGRVSRKQCTELKRFDFFGVGKYRRMVLVVPCVWTRIYLMYRGIPDELSARAQAKERHPHTTGEAYILRSPHQPLH